MPAAEEDTTGVQDRPLESVTVMVTVPTPPSEATMATRRLPGGGTKSGLLTVVADVVEALAGEEASSAMVPAGVISASATLPVSEVVAPTVTDPGVPVAEVVRQVPYVDPFVASLTSSSRVVLAAAVSPPELSRYGTP
jgi:hypothetical protein